MKGVFVCMKGMNLILVSVVLMLAFAGFVYAEVNDTLGNDTVVEIDGALLDEGQVEQIDFVIGDGDVVQDRESIFDRVVGYVSGVIDKINEVHENMFYILIIVLGVLLLIVYSVFFDSSSARVCFAKAISLHRRGEKAHVNGNHEKAHKLYGKSYLFREKGEGMVSGRSDESEN